MTREQKIAQARELRAQGFSYSAIDRALNLGGNLRGGNAYKLLNMDRLSEYARRDNAKRRAAKRVWERRKRAEAQ